VLKSIQKLIGFSFRHYLVRLADWFNSGQLRTASISCDTNAVFDLTNQSVKYDVSAGEDEQDITGRHARIFKLEPDARCEPIGVFLSLVGKVRDINHERL